MRNSLEVHSGLCRLSRCAALLAFATSVVLPSVCVLGDEFYPMAHAHNDYHHKRPLLDALDNGFCSAEADIFLVSGELLVGHTRFELKKDRTLNSLYLDPLKERVENNGGRVHKDGPTFTLLIDFKNKGEATYAVLRKQLMEYKELFVVPESKDQSDKPTTPAVRVVISGARPFDAIAADKQRLCGIDGRLSDLVSDKSPNLMPLISDNWRRHFKYRGQGEMSEEESNKLKEIVTKVHKAGRKVRFWATPETKEMWQILAGAGVDHINTDKLEELKSFLSQRTREQ